MIVKDNHSAGWEPGFHLSRLGAEMRAGFVELLRPWAIRPQHHGLLVALAAGDAVSQQELGERTGLDRGNLVELLDLLEGRALVRREPDPKDRRRHAVRLTEAGRQAVEEISAAATEHVDRFLAPLTRRQREQLAGALATLHRARHARPLEMR